MRRYYLQSAAVHFAVIGLLFAVVFFRPKQHLIMIEGIDFMGGGGGGGKTNTTGPKKEQMGQVVPTPVKTIVPQKAAPIQKETVAKETWTVKKPETPPPPPKPQEVEHAEKKQEETNNIIRKGITPQEKPGAGGFEFGDGAQGKAIGIGLGTGEGGGFAGFGSYLKVLRARIWQEWSQDTVLGSNETCVVGLTVSRSGDISDIKIEKASNNPFYDNVALRAVRNASPLPPLPSGFPSDTQRFRIQFHLVD